MYSSRNEETELTRFLLEVDRYGQECAEDAGTGLSDDMIAEYREMYVEINEEAWTPEVEENFDECFREGWNFYRYSVAD